MHARNSKIDRITGVYYRPGSGKIKALALRNVACALAVCQGLFAASVPPLICASGGAVAAVDLRVLSPSIHAANLPLPLRTMNRIEEGDLIRYRPLLRAHEVRKGDVTLVLIPANKKAAGRDKLLIFDPKPAKDPQQWKVPWRTSLVAFVYGPSGLNVKKVEAFLDKDDDLVGELADYADKTEKTEALIAALTDTDSSRETVGAALQGFSSQFGVSAQLTRGAPLDQQTMNLFRTLNPTIASYDPLSAQGSQPVGQTAGLATSVAEMFFGSPVGLAAGGTAMLLNLGAVAFPRSEFRSTFSQSMADDGLGLCGKVGPPPPHTRVAYLWAARVPNVGAPNLSVGSADTLPAGVKSPLPLTGNEPGWKYLDRARNWRIEPDRGKAIPVKVQVLANRRSIELELGRDLKPGRYSISANWDWDPFQVNGFFDVKPLADFAAAKLTPVAQDRLVANTGKVALTLAGADFEFVTKVEMQKLNDEFASASAVPFVLSRGLREGPQDHMDIQVDTAGLDPGAYKLMLSQVDGKSHDIRLSVLPPLPVVQGLPITVNQGTTSVGIALKGERLGLIQRLEASCGTAKLEPASADGTEREVNLQLPSNLAPGTVVSLKAVIAGRIEVMSIGEALSVVGPRPVITGVTLSQLPQQSVQLENGELPAGLTLSAMIRVSHLSGGSAIRLQCGDSAATLHAGQQAAGARVEQLTADELFVTFDTSGWTNGCDAAATVVGGTGDSAPHALGRVVNVPSIEEFETVPDPNGGPQISATLIGRKLETIAKIGWSADQATPISQLPQPLTGDGLQQKLDVHLPAPPSFDSVLYVWLRGNAQARATTVRAN